MRSGRAGIGGEFLSRDSPYASICVAGEGVSVTSEGGCGM